MSAAAMTATVAAAEAALCTFPPTDSAPSRSVGQIPATTMPVPPTTSSAAVAGRTARPPTPPPAPPPTDRRRRGRTRRS